MIVITFVFTKKKSLTVNMEAFPDNKDATVDFPTPLPPTMDTNDNWVLKIWNVLKGSKSLSSFFNKKSFQFARIIGSTKVDFPNGSKSVCGLISTKLYFDDFRFLCIRSENGTNIRMTGF